MNKSLLVLLLLIFVTFFSCQKESSFEGETANFGTREYYKSFLFYECDTLALTKKLKYDFNAYSIEKKSRVTIKLVDTAQNIISNKNIQFFINDNLIENNIFTLDSKVSQQGDLKIDLKFLPDYPEGYTSGFLSVSNHRLDVINNNDLNSSSEKRIFKWEATNKLIMNPFKKAIMWLGILILASLFVWFLVFRNKLYPKFKKGKLQISSPYFGGVSIAKNTRLIVFTDNAPRQKVFNKLFTGKIVYEVNPIYEKDIVLRPGRGNKIKIKLPIGASIKPAVINLEKFNNYKVKLNNIIIEIQYS